jgi:hypothetical protein
MLESEILSCEVKGLLYIIQMNFRLTAIHLNSPSIGSGGHAILAAEAVFVEAKESAACPDHLLKMLFAYVQATEAYYKHVTSFGCPMPIIGDKLNRNMIFAKALYDEASRQRQYN